MAKRKVGLTEKKIDQMEKDGRGQGKGQDYLPWITIQDFPSHGLSTRSKGWKTNRIHHFLSKNELDYFYILEWDSSVIDIREQFPLIREDTFHIASNKGLKHPADPKTQVPIVMTTDFLITVQHAAGYEKYARTVKPSKELEDKRTIEKFEIERTYWNDRGISWGIVTEKELPRAFVDNVKWLHSSYYDMDNHPALEMYINNMIDFLKKRNMSIIEIATEFDNTFMLENGTGLSLIKYLIAHKKVPVNINQKLHTHLWVEDIFTL